MANPKVRKFAGDLRFWQYGSGAERLPVIPEASDAFGNQPIEQNTLVFSYEAGETTNVTSKRRDDRYGQITHSDSNPGTTAISITLLEVPPLILARMLYGSGTSGAVAAGAVTDVAYTAHSKDVPIKLAHRYLLASPAPVVEKGGTPLVAGTDYTIDGRQGLLIPKAGGDIESGDELTVSYSYDDYIRTAINGGATPNEKFHILGDVEDRISGENGLLRIPQVDLTVDGDVDWFSAEPIQVTLTGNVVFRSEESALYTFETYEQAA